MPWSCGGDAVPLSKAPAYLNDEEGGPGRRGGRPGLREAYEEWKDAGARPATGLRRCLIEARLPKR
jgi:hypothetical protein